MRELDEVRGLDAMLRDAADDAARRTIVAPYDVVRTVALRRRTARLATAGAFGLVLCVVIGLAAVGGIRRDAGPDRRPQPVASAVALDPSLLRYVTTIPILAWAPDDGLSANAVGGTQEFISAVFAPLKGDHDFSYWTDLRKMFPDAPIGGNAVVLDQSFARAQLEKSAANVRKLHGVKYARVVEVKGLWFTVTGYAPAGPDAGAPPPIDLRGISIVGGEATGGSKGSIWARATYVGPPITRATFDLMRRRAAEAVQGELSKVVVKAESAEPQARVTR
jgi:hypothetical protein